ncbi:5'-nucleotidase [Parvibium lacunae]|uniref:5'-nucleotidase n=1 Tax=Parvibium lacunae TaxID=1888893 RepID=A0A368L0D8_9BURK|nr:5'-nucleotidase [Parvibium lacunae]RCS57030.1 5'-nucleotidase [Parvibium lacunae]
MAVTLQDKLVVALSSRALFDFEEENQLFEEAGSQSYVQLQLTRLTQPAQPGVAFPLVQKLLRFNADGQHRVEVVILSRNDPVSGLRVFHSAQENHLQIERGVFTQGRTPFKYLRPLGAKLFLSVNESDVRQALEAGFPAARVFPDSIKSAEANPDEIRIAFDGDAVLFADDSERVFKERGLNAFQSHEAQYAQTPLPPGPFVPLLQAIHLLQTLPANQVPVRIRTALVTARSAPAHERAIRTLMSWQITIDEAMFLGGLEKGPFLQEFEPDFFFDDQTRHCESAKYAGPTGHVVHGVANPR